MREKIAQAVYYDCTDCPYKGEGDCVEPKACKFAWDKADQILAVLEPQMLTPEEARELMECFDYEPTGRYANKQYALYLKLQGIAEGQ